MSELNNDHMKPRFPERMQDVEAEHVRPVLTQILDALLRIEVLLTPDRPVTDRGNYEDRVTPKTPAEKPAAKGAAAKKSRW
jgi:hypothetical protein